jgi:hypothetical protein
MEIVNAILTTFMSFFSSLVVAGYKDENTAKNYRYGANFSPYYAMELGLDWKKTLTAVLDDLKVTDFRLGAYWNSIEISDGIYDFSDLDWQIQEIYKRQQVARTDGSIILAIGRKVPRWPECHDPSFIKEKGEKEQQEKLLEFLEAVVLRYKNSKAVKYWQVENEPFFPFGECPRLVADKNFLADEINLVRRLDPSRKMITQDSGEGGLWFLSKRFGDILAISLYKSSAFKLPLINKSVYFTYPLPPSFYRYKAFLMGIDFDKIIVSELQTEPWGTKSIVKMTEGEKNKTMSKERFLETVDYAKKSKIAWQYFWGVEWWYWEKEQKNSFFWDSAKEVIQESKTDFSM